MACADEPSAPPGDCSKPIGQILVEKGLITPDQLQQALDIQAQQPEQLLGEILVHLGVVTARDVAGAYAEQVLLMYECDDESASPVAAERADD